MPSSLSLALGILGLSLVLWVVSRKTSWKAAGGWAALALAGQACALQFIEAGPYVRFPRFYGLAALFSSVRPIFFLTLLIQTGVVVWRVARVWPRGGGKVAPLLSRRQWAAFLALNCIAVAVIDPYVLIAWVQTRSVTPAGVHLLRVAFGLWVFGSGTFSLVLAARSVPRESWLRLHTLWLSLTGSRLPWIAAAWVVLASGLLAWFVWERVPHIPDEVAYLFMAKYFSLGHLSLPPPPDPNAFAAPFQLLEARRWYSAQIAGWPFVLAVGYWLTIPWLVNPLLGGAAILLTHVFVRRYYDRNTANAVILLLALSPWLLFMSATFMPHSVSLALILAGFVTVQRAREGGGLAWGLLAGGSFGLLLHVRPLEAVSLALVAGVWWLTAGLRKRNIPALAGTLAAGLVFVFLYVAYNRALTGDPWYEPINKLYDTVHYPGLNRLGFGPGRGNVGWPQIDALPGHSPVEVLLHTAQNISLVNLEMFGWACGSLLLVFWWALRGRIRDDLLMWSMIAAVWLGLGLYWFGGGPDLGARYWYPMIAPLAVLTVRGAQGMAAHLNIVGQGEEARHSIQAFVILASLVGFINVVSWRAADKYYHYRGARGDVRELAHAHGFGQSLVFVRSEVLPSPQRTWSVSSYASAFALNPPTLDRDARGPIYALDLGPESRERICRYYENRSVWVLAGPEATGDGFLVVAGPIPPGNPEACRNLSEGR